MGANGEARGHTLSSMLRRNTVLLLGAGASIPYQFPSGDDLLRQARHININALPDFVSPGPRAEVPALFSALQGTLERSIDAMLETRPDIVKAGKAYMARHLLNCERNVRVGIRENPGQWYEILWTAFDLRSLDSFRASKLTIVTYNYDRSIEYAIIRSLQERFSLPAQECAKALDCVGPIHLHGMLGRLPDLPGDDATAVPYGGDMDRITDSNCLIAASGIRIVHEPNPQDEPFVRARDAISNAGRLIVLGFGYARSNVERLKLHECLSKDAEVYLCATGFTPPQQLSHIRCHFGPWSQSLRIGSEVHDIVNFFRQFPEALL